jgi:rubrerythrin
MRKWIRLDDYHHNKLVTHEVRCPECGYKETFHGDSIPDSCYLCESKLKG